MILRFRTAKPLGQLFNYFMTFAMEGGEDQNWRAADAGGAIGGSLGSVKNGTKIRHI
jgi:hypothetical protein